MPLSKTFKEAQSKAQFLNTVCIIPMFISILELSLSSTYYLIPICNYEQILSELFTNNINIVNLFITLGSTVVYIIVVLFFISKTYNQEKVLFK